MDDAGVVAIYGTGRVPVGVSEEQLLRLGGEAVLKERGCVWDERERRRESANGGQVMIGMEALGVEWDLGEKMLALGVDEQGIVRERFVVWGEVFRQGASYFSNFHEGRNLGLDSLVLRKESVEGEGSEARVFTGMQTVDSLWKDRPDRTIRNQSYEHPVLGTVQGNTIMSDVWLRLFKVNSGGWDGLGLLHNAVVMDGDIIQYTGYDDEEDSRWWLHTDHNGYYWASDGCFMFPPEIYSNLVNTLYTEWGLKNNYEIYLGLYETWRWTFSESIWGE
ncbi:hypothetical protein Spith_2069 [Spirochaeta thermophila DSM 6578]|uniref:Uncharacterized protein n=1 Tax=Winmispira thermophila (strain ATCC 700085 / DSM 6578 / Z-1203) TaxID=869211 RepID=G0GEY1_WINT7|nr:hypothetical protein [Spirochaeta thermophila]AEJ62325.1 hypothetical protein Spith_2069 [Spirochaeta thermophila DSM 6578]